MTYDTDEGKKIADWHVHKIMRGLLLSIHSADFTFCPHFHFANERKNGNKKNILAPLTSIWINHQNIKKKMFNDFEWHGI